MINVLLVDDQELIREGLGIILDSEPDIRVVDGAADGREGVRAALEHKPDLILMDIKMPVMDGLEATRRIKAELPETPVVILTTYADDDLVYEGIRAGASGYLLKDIGRQALAEAVRGAVRGEAQINASVATKVLAEFQRMADAAHSRQSEDAARPAAGKEAAGSPDPLIEELTEREERILRLLTEGLTNAGIATFLHLSEGTVKNHVSDILRKLQAHDRTHAVVLAIRRGLLELD